MYTLIRDFEELKKVKIDYDKPVFCDTETCEDEGESEGGLYGKVRLFQFFQEGWHSAIIVDCFFVPIQYVLNGLKDAHTVWHNGSFDLHTINRKTPSYWISHKVDDTVYMSRLCFFDKRKFGFYECLKYAKLEDEFIRSMDKNENQKYKWSGPISETAFKYAAADVIYLEKLYSHVKQVKEKEAYQLDIWSMRYAVKYSRRGITTNQNTVIKKLRECEDKLEKVLNELPVNPNSPKQVKDWLGTNATDMETLIKLSLEGDDRAKQVRDARQLSKERTYLVKYNRPKVYGFFNPSSAISGRFSCTGGDVYDAANLQQVPRRLLPCFEAPPGMVIVYKDYAGVELRNAVAYTGEPTMERMMRNNVDLHSYTASQIFGISLEEAHNDKIKRLCGKVLNFNLIYGAMAPTIMSTLRSWGGIALPIKDVKKMIDAWFELYPYFKTWHDLTMRHLRIYGYLDVETALGRKIRVTSINDALNFPIQGTSSEVIKMSHKYLWERYPDENLVVTIHDANALLVKEQEADTWVERLNECMVDAWFYVIKDTAIPDLPMPAEAEYGKVWDF